MISAQKLLDLVAAKIATYPMLLVGYSGGIDSTVLLYLLYQIRQTLRPDLQIHAVHVHHGLSAYADDWVEHCKKQCRHWHIPLIVRRVQLNLKEKNIEAVARAARYQVFQEQLLVGQALVTAHHLDDQCETFLLALKRGSGPKGLSSMAACREFSDSDLLRPLLTVSKTSLRAYATQQQLSWIEDDSNLSTCFDRNFLRAQIIPSLMQRWPQFATMVARSAMLCAEQETLLDHYLAQDLAKILDKTGCLSLTYLQESSEVKSFALLRSWLAHHKILMPSREQLRVILYEIVLAKADASPHIKLGEHVIRRFKNKLYLLPVTPPIIRHVLVWDLNIPLALPHNLGVLRVAEHSALSVRLPDESESVTIRFFSHERVILLGKKQSRPIKKIWQDLQVPPWLRRQIPLLYYNETLIAAIGYFVTEASRPRDIITTIAIEHFTES